MAMHAMKALDEAKNHSAAVLRMVPDHDNATLNLGVIRQSFGFREEAEGLYRRALDLGVDKARVNNNLALVLAERGRLEEAEAACDDALADNPDYPEALVNLGMILLMRGNLAEGWPFYEMRWRVPPPVSRSRLPPATRGVA